MGVIVTACKSAAIVVVVVVVVVAVFNLPPIRLYLRSKHSQRKVRVRECEFCSQPTNQPANQPTTLPSGRSSDYDDDNKTNNNNDEDDDDDEDAPTHPFSSTNQPTADFPTTNL